MIKKSMFLLILVLSIPVVFADNIKEEKLTLSEKIQLFFSFSKEAKAQKYLELAKKRLDRLNIIKDKNESLKLLNETQSLIIKSQKLGQQISDLAKQQKFSNETNIFSSKVHKLVDERQKNKNNLK